MAKHWVSRILRKINKRRARLWRKTFRRIKYTTPFKSQRNQDLWVIFSALPFKRNGFFVELAAADGVTHSNTYALERLFGWRGICIEPNPRFHQALKKRRSCLIDNSAVSDSEEIIDFRIDNEQRGGIVADDTDNKPETRGDQQRDATIISLKTTTLMSILERLNAPRLIDYLSLDVEGSEERVLRNFDFDRYRFQCLTIERPTPELNQLLFENGYVFVKNHRDDTFYVHETLREKRDLKCRPFEQVGKKIG